jgi:quercetin dioxygenase-like cupin family protein
VRDSGVVVGHPGERLHAVLPEGVGVESWAGDDVVEHDGCGTAFVIVLEPTTLTVAHGTHPVPALGYAVLPEPARLERGSGLVITAPAYNGLFQVGGPVEPRGRLHYIDGCSDTVLVPPAVRGDPCLNLLHLPPGTRQTDHEHPSVRVGVVLTGEGVCVSDGAHRDRLAPGYAFVLAPRTVHHFETPVDSSMLLIAWHPDSDTGPTDDDHPMLNRTLQPRTAVRVR